MADGKIVIDTELDTDGIEKDLKQAEKSVDNAAKQIEKTFDEMSKESGESVSELKDEAKTLADEYQKQSRNISDSFEKAYEDMSDHGEDAAQKMKESAQNIEESMEKSADRTSDSWKDSLNETEKNSTSAQKSVKSDAEKMKEAQENASEKSKEAWGDAFDRIKSLAATAAQVTAAAIAGVSAALVSAGAYAVSVGSDFEAAMSKVEAISGATESQMEQLTQKAKEMGAATKFSATESAEAFQYMAMAGWESAEMIDGIDGIMNLAAADGLDLATTSDIVTDALTAFGLAASDSTHFADVLATASSSANTNVSMLGESFKYVAPVAGAMSYSVEDVSKALGLMANASVKGSMAGTSLKTALSNMAAPTDNMREAMKKYGISLTDSEGNMKSLDAVMKNLRKSLGDLSEKEQTAAASTIFGKEAMAGMLAIINASEKDYKDLTKAIANADGTAQRMADTMNDNLQGKVTLAKSALEGLGIQFYETVQEDMKDAVEEGITYVDELSYAFTNGGLEAAVDKSGDIIAELATNIAKCAPDMVNASTDLIKAFVDGLGDNKRQLKQASQEIVDAICEGLIKLLPKEMQEPVKKALDSLSRTFKAGTKNMLNISKKNLELITKLFSKLADHMDTIIPTIVSMVAAYKSFQMVNGPVQTVVSVIKSLKKISEEAGLATTALNAVMNANPATLIAGAIALLVAGLVAYIATSDRADEAQEAFNRKIDEMEASIEKTQNELDSLRESMENTYSSIESSTAPIEKWKEQLGEAVDSTGKVKDGCEEMATYILTQLNEAMGTNYKVTADGFIKNNEGVKQSLDDINASIDEYIQSLKQKSLQEAASAQYSEALQRQSETTANLTDAQKAYNEALEAYSEAVKDYMENNELKGLDTARENLERTQQAWSESTKAAQEATVELSGLDAVMEKLAEGTPESVQEALDMYAQIPVAAQKAADGISYSQEQIQQALNSTDYVKMTEGFRLAVEEIESSGGQISENLRDCIVEALDELEQMGPEGQEKMRVAMGKMLEGMSSEIPEFEDTASKSAEDIIAIYKQYLLDSGALNTTGREAISFLSAGMSEAEPEAVITAQEVVEETVDAATEKAEEKKTEVAESGADLMSAISEGAASVDTTTVPTQKAQDAADSVIDCANVAIPAIEQAAQSDAEAINTGYANADVTTDASQTGTLSVQALIDAINSLRETVEQASKAIGESATQGLSSADMTSAFAKQGSDAASQVGISLTNNTGVVSSAASALGQASANALKGVNLSTNFQTQAKTSVAMFASGIRVQTSVAVNATKTLGITIINALKSIGLSTQANTQGKLFASGFAGGIRGQSSAASSAATTIGNSAKNALGNMYQSGNGIGMQFSNGLANGIRSGGAGVAAAAAAVANAAAQAAMKNLEIHSPSRVGNYIGQMFDLGIEQDIRKGVSGIENAVDTVTDSMKIDPAKILSDMKNAFNYNVNRISSETAIRKNSTFGNSVNSESSISKNTLNQIVDRLAERFADEMENVTIYVGKRQFGRLVRAVQ